jgi:seryl-tRNA synthetase
MIDIKLIRSNPKEVEERLRRRDASISLDPIIDLDEKRRSILVELESKENVLNTTSKQIGQLRKEGKDAALKIRDMKNLSNEIAAARSDVRQVEEDLKKFMSYLPNIPDDSVPVSDKKEDLIVIREHKKKPSFSFKPKNHLELSETHGLFDLRRGAKIAESQFPMYRGVGAMLEMALLNFMLDYHMYEKGYDLILPPLLVNPTTMFTSGNLPKFEDQLYKLRDDDLYLIPTSEVPLTSIHRDEILKEEELPLRYIGYTPNFRREAGTYGTGERGLIRMHQFNKIEMYAYTAQEQSDEEFERIIADAEELLKRLDLHYRVTLLVTSDMAQQSAKTCDLEVWLPAQNAYYEVSSVSNCRDYQAIRGNIRYKTRDKGKNKYVHTLNGSGLATSRLMIGVLETYQQEDGSITVPEALRKYMGGMERIG